MKTQYDIMVLWYAVLDIVAAWACNPRWGRIPACTGPPEKAAQAGRRAKGI